MRLAAEQVVNLTLKELSRTLVVRQRSGLLAVGIKRRRRLGTTRDHATAAEATKGAPQVDRAPASEAPAP